MSDIIIREKFEKLVEQLVNSIDRFLVVGIYYGFADGGDTSALLALKKTDVDFKTKTIKIQDRVVKMDAYLEKITRDAINQKTYMKMGRVGFTNEDYELNSKSPYIIRTKGTASNNDGLNPLTCNGFRNRMLAIRKFLDIDISVNLLRRSGAFDLIIKNNKNSLRTAEELLEGTGLTLSRGTLVQVMREVKKLSLKDNFQK